MKKSLGYVIMAIKNNYIKMFFIPLFGCKVNKTDAVEELNYYGWQVTDFFVTEIENLKDLGIYESD